MTTQTFDHTATYSPEDNKLRLYPAYRLDTEEYQNVSDKGFRWAPKQELFVAPSWTPEREDFLIELCGEIGDEDTSLVDRAQIRAERFDGYSVKRANEAGAAFDYVKSIADNIPFGQPILVGHHSERRARRDAEKIDNGMRKSVNLWKTSQYWEMRAEGALCHAKYKELPGVRARRIKKLEAEIRKYKSQYTPHPADQKPIMQEGFYDDKPSLHVFCGKGRGGHWVKLSSLERIKKHYSRYIQHNERRLIYEKVMLEAQGASDLLKPKKRPKQLPLCNYRAPEGIRIENQYHRGEFSTYPQKEMTKAEYRNIYKERKGTRVVENSHRVRIVIQNRTWSCVFITDSKVHKKPEPVIKTKAPETGPTPRSTYKAPERTKFDDLEDSLRHGVRAVSAPQLFPTPPELAQRMVNYAGIKDEHTVLEPSAGTANLLKAMGPAPQKVAVEINGDLVKNIAAAGIQNLHTRHDDFLSCSQDIGHFDRIVMNPPFERGQDIKHIKHAMNFLKPGGRIVALCANGPKQKKELKPLAEKSGGYWEELPPGTFANQGTAVSVSMLIIESRILS